MRSDVAKGGPSRAPHRSLLKATGLTGREISRPLIGVVTSQNDMIPGHINLDKMVEAVKKGILLSDRTPLVFPTIEVCDGVAMRHERMKYSLVTRELIADTIECVIKAHGSDTLALIPDYNRIVPGVMMTVLRLDIPSVIVSGGPVLAGKFRGKEVSLSTMFGAAGVYGNGTMLEGDLCELENKACPTCGSCSGIFMANPMNCLAEVLGLALPDNGAIPAVCSERIRLAKYAEIRIMGLLERDIKPRDIVNGRSIKNALTVDMALGCSTNSVLHLAAIANEAKVEINLDIINEISSKIPNLCKLAPAFGTHIEDLYWAGGMQAAIMELSKKDLLELECIATTSETHKESLKDVVVSDSSVIRSIESPYGTTSGIQVSKGNLAEDGAVVKKSAVLERILTHRGPAKVFDSEEEAIEAILFEKVIEGDVVIVRYGGPKGGPGMKEMLSPTSTITGMGLNRYVALITNGRSSGATRGATIRRVSPETTEGGSIALVEEGNTISIDISNGKLELLVDEEVLARGRKNLKILEPKVKERYLVRYTKLVSLASRGAVLE